MLMDTLMPNTSGVGTQILAIMWVTFMLYTLAPLAFTYFLGVVGVRAGTVVSQAIGDASESAGKPAGNAVDMVKTAIAKGKR